MIEHVHFRPNLQKEGSTPSSGDLKVLLHENDFNVIQFMRSIVTETPERTCNGVTR